MSKGAAGRSQHVIAVGIIAPHRSFPMAENVLAPNVVLAVLYDFLLNEINLSAEQFR